MLRPRLRLIQAHKLTRKFYNLLPHFVKKLLVTPHEFIMAVLKILVHYVVVILHFIRLIHTNRISIYRIWKIATIRTITRIMIYITLYFGIIVVILHKTSICNASTGNYCVGRFRDAIFWSYGISIFIYRNGNVADIHNYTLIRVYAVFVIHRLRKRPYVIMRKS